MNERFENMYDRFLIKPNDLEDELVSDVRIQDTAILSELRDQAYRYLKWGQLASIAESRYNRLKAELETVLWPKAFSEARDDLARKGDKTTDTATTAKAYTIDWYQAAKTRILKAESAMAAFKRAEGAIYHRGLMLQSLSSRQKHELSYLPEDEERLKDGARKKG